MIIPNETASERPHTPPKRWNYLHLNATFVMVLGKYCRWACGCCFTLVCFHRTWLMYRALQRIIQRDFHLLHLINTAACNQIHIKDALPLCLCVHVNSSMCGSLCIPSKMKVFISTNKHFHVQVKNNWPMWGCSSSEIYITEICKISA